jgi:hypothetical protein
MELSRPSQPTSPHSRAGRVRWRPRATRRPRVSPAYGRFDATAVDHMGCGPSAPLFKPCAPRCASMAWPLAQPATRRGAACRSAHACMQQATWPCNALWPARGRSLVEVQARLGQINPEATIAVAVASAVAAVGVAAAVSLPPSQTDTSLASLALPKTSPTPKLSSAPRFMAATAGPTSFDWSSAPPPPWATGGARSGPASTSSRPQVGPSTSPCRYRRRPAGNRRRRARLAGGGS